MAVNRTGGTGGTGGTQGPGNANVIRPMYGIFVRDAVEGMRDDIKATMADTKKAIAAGSARAREVRGDGILQGTELSRAKAAVKDMERAIKALKPVNVRAFGGGGGSASNSPAPSTTVTGGRPPIAMYGVILRDDLDKFRSKLNSNIATIKKAIKEDNLPAEAKKEARAAVKALEAALKDLNTARRALH